MSNEEFATKVNVKAFYDGKIIEAYCNCHGYSAEDILALREIHRLQLSYEFETQSRSPKSTLEEIASNPHLRRVLRERCPELCGAIFRMADDPAYADKILRLYEKEVRPALCD